jgi:hypothetical protein
VRRVPEARGSRTRTQGTRRRIGTVSESHSTHADAGQWGELPRTSIIVSFDHAHRRICSKPVSAEQWLRDALAAASRDDQRMRARHLLTAEKRRRTREDVLSRAAARMSDVDLDSAWRAALRGDTRVLTERLTPHLSPPRKRVKAGSPWRSSGWIAKR